ncbi:MAG TPA: dienelactone hydrolase family protein [Gemmataceae bacterium]|jgi:dienelactone hydrolase|nr:dienelactone hydrolase family protein [Gemmataceae bacterium]
MFRTVVVVMGWLVLVGSASADLQTKKIAYKHGDLECQGYLAWDDAVQGPRPGVLVVHEWWGLNNYARGRAEQLAKLGYVAFAADMYGEGKVTEHPKEAGAMAAKVRANVQDWRKRAATALDVLMAQPQCDKTRLAAIGYCFGGSTALELAYAGADLKAVVTFHAALPAPKAEEAKQIKATLLVCHGADDKFIPEQAIKSFRDALDKAGVKYEFVSYPDTVHSFTVPGADKHNIPGMKYNKSADEDSWKRLVALLAEKFAS